MPKLSIEEMVKKCSDPRFLLVDFLVVEDLNPAVPSSSQQFKISFSSPPKNFSVFCDPLFPNNKIVLEDLDYIPIVDIAQNV